MALRLILVFPSVALKVVQEAIRIVLEVAFITVTEDKIEDSYLSILLRSTIEARVLGTEKSVVPCIALDLDSQTDEDGPGSKLRCWFRRKAGEQDLKSPQEKERGLRTYHHVKKPVVRENVRESPGVKVVHKFKEKVLNGVSGSSSGASIIFNQLVHIHLLYFLGHHPAIFVDSDHFIHKYFLPQDYAILVPVFAGVTLLSLLSVFIGMVMLKSKKKKA
ncbi:hypothetical protein Bca52824_024848 [Brassica carinata]|uniref:Dolichol phosphate-mannose biosynthesis regulatory protein n=1 Tax=Brassica carinata TaxID=52824 RepID=A0A8X7VL66_BRACI|nr:hypothetical protein Bca52824_024848 [Brassica carinata]